MRKKTKKRQPNTVLFLSARRKIFLTYSIICLILLGITIWFTFPLIKNFSSAIISDPKFTDGPFFIWNLWWFKKAIMSFNCPFISDYVYYPAPTNLAMHTPTFTSGLMYILLSPFTNLTASLNLIQVFSFIASGLGIIILVNYIAKASTVLQRLSTLVAASIFAFNPYIFSHLIAGHYNLSMVWPIPFVILFLLMLIEEPKLENIIGLGIFSCLLGYLDLQLTFFTLIICLPLLVAEIIHRKKFFFYKKLLLALLYSAAIFFMIFAGPYGYYLNKFWDFKDSMITYNSGDFRILLGHNPLNPLFGQQNFLLLGKLIGSYRENIISLSWVGLSIAVLGLMLFPRNQIRHKIVFLLTALVALVLTLGPFYQFNGLVDKTIKLPYFYLQNLPFFNLGLVPTRFILIVHFAVAVLAGLAIVSITKFFEDKKLFLPAFILPLVVSLFILVENYSGLMPLDHLEEIKQIKEIANEHGDFTVLPYHSDQKDAFLQTLHGRPVVTGFLGRRIHDYYMSGYKEQYPINQIAKGSLAPNDLNTDPDKALQTLKSFKIKYIIADKRFKSFEEMKLLSDFAAHLKIENQFENSNVVIYSLN